MHPACLAVTSIILIGSVGWWAGTNTTLTKAGLENAKIASSAWTRAGESINNVDLFAFISATPDASKSLTVLSTYDRGLYARIFDAQQTGDFTRANAMMKRVHNNVLMGHVLYDRYIRSSDYKASYAELRAWMEKYGDHPDAYKVYQLAQKRRQNDPAALPAPQITQKLFGSLELAWLKKKETTNKSLSFKPAKRNNADVRQLMGGIKQRLSNDQVTSAYNLLGKSPAAKMLSAIEYDSLLSEIAGGYYYNAKYDTALKLSEQALKRSKESVPFAAWIAGLSSWQNENYAQSARYFETIVSSHNRSPWLLSAAAFWAARAHEKMGHSAISDDWLHEASSYPRTFYGLVALQKIGSSMDFSWQAPPLTNNLVSAMKHNASGIRALALLDVGRKDLAVKELNQIHPNGNHRLEKALIATANHYNLPELAIRLGNALGQPDGKLYDVALYPVVPWKGEASNGVDPALINALIRQESKFDAGAQNARSGAKGLMQLMPSTARFVSDVKYNARDLHKPQVNIVLGQRYIRHLLDLPSIKGNLLYLAAAYNAGPGNLARWQKTIKYNDDPFLFIESIPMSETRGFVERVMTNFWIYRERLGEEAETLEQLAQDQWPVYESQNDLKMASYFN